VAIEDDGKGGYKATYVLPSGGAWTLHVALNDKDINGSPFKVHATAVADPSKCRAFGLGLKHATVGKRATFCVELYSSAGKPVDMPPAIRVGNVVADVVALGDGMFDVSYMPIKEGPLTVEVLTSNEGPHVHKSPFDVTVAPATRVRLGTHRQSLTLYAASSYLDVAGELRRRARQPTVLDSRESECDWTRRQGGASDSVPRQGHLQARDRTAHAR
jgi:hypothetical protein